jgi:ribosome biogenesis protein Tsr3
VINPVRFGAGLKIKTVEALANGLPLVTSEEGARGLASLDREAILIARNVDQFKAAA